MRHKKKIVLLVLVSLMTFSLSGCGLFETMLSLSDGQPTSFSSAYDLASGKAYVWHHEGGNIEEDIKNGAEKDVFFTCITGDYNFKGSEMEDISMYPRSIWIDSGTDGLIPTVTSKDRLIYVSKTEVPESIIFERFADYGDTI